MCSVKVVDPRMRVDRVAVAHPQREDRGVEMPLQLLQLGVRQLHAELARHHVEGGDARHDRPAAIRMPGRSIRAAGATPPTPSTTRPSCLPLPPASPSPIPLVMASVLHGRRAATSSPSIARRNAVTARDADRGARAEHVSRAAEPAQRVGRRRPRLRSACC